MVKDIIKYDNKEYQLSTIYIENMITFETMIFPIKNGKVSGEEVYCFRTLEANESKWKHTDIYEHPEKYVSEEAITEYLKTKFIEQSSDLLIAYEKVSKALKEFVAIWR